MNFSRIEDIGLATASFLRGEYPIAPVTHKWKSLRNIREVDKLNFLKESILEFWGKYSISEKLKIIGFIDDAIQDLKRNAETNPDIKRRIVSLKKALATAEISNWKDALLDLRLSPVIDNEEKYYLRISYTASADIVVQLNERRFRFFTKSQSPHKESYAVIGSTFLTNSPNLLQANSDDNNDSVSHVLDACYGVYLLERDGEVNGAIVAVADGCGGHFGEEAQDRAIAKTAYVASRHAVRLLATFQQPDDLLRAIPELIEILRNEIIRKYPRSRDNICLFQEGTTIACGRSFVTETGFRFVGFSIGDSMIGAWSPEKKIWQTLAPSRVKVLMHGRTATAIFPTAYKPEEIHPIDVMLEKDTVIIPFTDGAYDYLPCERVNKKYADDSDYQETTLVATEMRKLLRSKKIESVKDIITAITEYSITKINEQRTAGLIKANEAEIALASYVKEQKDLAEKSNKNTQKSRQEKSLENDKLQQLHADRGVQLGDDFTLFGVRVVKTIQGSACSTASTSSTVLMETTLPATTKK